MNEDGAPALPVPNIGNVELILETILANNIPTRRDRFVLTLVREVSTFIVAVPFP